VGDGDLTIERIRSKLGSDDPSIRGRGAHEAGELGDARLVPDLVHLAAFDAAEFKTASGMVDEYTTVAAAGTNALGVLYGKIEFTEGDAARIREVAVDPRADDESVSFLLGALRRWVGPLIEVLSRDPSPIVRVRALIAGDFAHLFSPIPFLEDPAPEVRKAAIRRVGYTPRLDGHGTELLSRAVDDADAGVRAAAARELGIRRIHDPLLRRLDIERDPDVRLELASALARWVSREAALGLARLIADPDARLRVAVARALERAAFPEVGRALLARLRVEGDQDVRNSLVSYRHYPTGAPEALPLLLDLLRRDERPRPELALSVRRFGPAAVSGLLDAWSEMTHAGKRWAAWILGDIGDPRALPTLRAALRESPDPDLAGALEECCEKLHQRAEAIARLEDPAAEAGDRRRAVDHLWRVDADAAIEHELRHLEHADKEVRTRAVWALTAATLVGLPEPEQRRIRRIRILDGLALRLGREPDPSVRVQIVRAFGSPGLNPPEEAHLPALVAAVADADPEVRAEAALHLGSLGDPRAIAALEAARKGANPRRVAQEIDRALEALRGGASRAHQQRHGLSSGARPSSAG
jgi:HEAT repeat protein